MWISTFKSLARRSSNSSTVADSTLNRACGEKSQSCLSAGWVDNTVASPHTAKASTAETTRFNQPPSFRPLTAIAETPAP